MGWSALKRAYHIQVKEETQGHLDSKVINLGDQGPGMGMNLAIDTDSVVSGPP